MEQNNSSDLLLVIDMQNVYTKGQEWACKGIEHASASILHLLNSQKQSRSSLPNIWLQNTRTVSGKNIIKLMRL